MTRKNLVLLVVAASFLTVGAGCVAQNANKQKDASNGISVPIVTTTSDNKAVVPKMVYENKQYGFSLEFPNTWEGYVAKNRTLDWGVNGSSDSIDFGFVAQDSLFNVGIFSKSQWQKIKSEEGLTPTYLGENGDYVFGLAVSQYDANDVVTARKSETKDIVKTFKVTTIVVGNTPITYYLLSTNSKTSFCDGANMDSVGYKAALTKKTTQTVVGGLTTEEKIKTTLRLAAGAEQFGEAYARTASTTFENSIVTMHSANGWAGSSIFYCAWKPFVEKNLEQFGEVKEIKWVSES